MRNMIKKDLENMFRAVACAVYRVKKNPRPTLQKIAVYRVGEDICLAATDGYRLHVAAACPLRQFEESFKKQPYILIEPCKFGALLKMYRANDAVDVDSILAQSRAVEDTEYPLLGHFSSLILAELELEDENVHRPIYCVNPKYLGDLRHFVAPSKEQDVFLWCQGGVEPTDPLLFAADVEDYHYRAIIMPRRRG